MAYAAFAALSVLALILPTRLRADDALKYAEHGVQAYQAGKFDLARLFFSKALQDAVLKGKEDWIVKGTLNLVDLELEAQQDQEAERLLTGLATHDKFLRSLVLWKASQLAYQQKRFPQALAGIDSALELSVSGSNTIGAMELDRMKYTIQSQPVTGWGPAYSEFKKHFGRMDKAKTVSLEAMAAMSLKDFAGADTLWRETMGYYRDQGRLAKVAACLNQSAICLFSLSRREEALETNARSVAIYGELGLEIPALRAQALRIVMLDDRREVAKLRQDMDLLAQRVTGFDLQGILDEYSHHLRDGLPGLGP